ncbi:TIGR01777 family oxidoreductase [Neobacillus cucumis]|uniref:TIGR01777 family oxidoreductase n=1 Tax=Neobacillus cucumis TaxID=1740721 RepID=UPI0028536F97|nr:TIGR01777 family oxidoreductase [Neobacillus cucumis]MDR4947263.1 TIGR01777 family oxidoreductase [Neobacillus cucumis]
MKILIAGGSGFIGRIVTGLLLEEGHDIVILTRKKKPSERNIKYIQWLETDTSPENEIKRADVVINLAGVSINAGRWTTKHQKQIYESRMIATEELIRIVAALPEKPSVFINASAIGIYPPSLQGVYTEKSLEVADDFLGRTVNDWEQKAATVSTYGIRTVFMRFGVVLGNEGGALPLMVLPYKVFMGGRMGSGKQWVSWVHVKDVARALLFAITNDHLNGPVNITAPNPKRMEEFGRTIGSVLHRPHWLPVPSLMMKLVLGKKSTLVLEGQFVVPEVLKETGFEFEFPTLESALKDLLAKKGGSPGS